jgi:hypothetical protein
LGRTGALGAKKMDFSEVHFEVICCSKRNKKNFQFWDFWFKLQAQIIEKRGICHRRTGDG